MLIEILVAMGLMALLLPAILTGLVASREGKAQEGQRLEATALLREAEEATRSVRENWSTFATEGTYHPEILGTSWVLVGGSENINGYTRQIEISDAQRDSNFNIVETGGTVDPSTKKVQTTVSWSSPLSSFVESTSYYQRYVNNTTWVQTTQADFLAGTHNNTRATNQNGGAVRLDEAGGTQEFTDEYETAGDYSFDPNKIEVTGGFAQLKPQGPVVSGQTINSGFDTDTNGWTFSTWRSNVGQTGNWQASGGNPGGYAQINLPPERRVRAGGYWYQPFTTTINNPTATLTFDWKVTNFDPIPQNFRLYAFVDAAPGEPDAGTNVWDSGEITGTTSWSETVTLDVSSSVTTAQTYYLKVAVLVRYPRNQTAGPYTAGFDNVLLAWSKATGSYPVDGPPITRNTSFSASSITSWESFVEISQTNGGSIFYQLSDDDGSSWQYYNGSTWVVAVGSTDYNDAATVNNQINSFPTTNNKINVKAYLISDGTQFVRLDTVTIGYQGLSAGTFTSSTFDAGGIVGFNSFVWTQRIWANTTISFQVAINTDNTTWQFKGPDGTGSTYFTNESGTIPLTMVSGQYIRYRINFTSLTDDRPRVFDVSINYSP